MVLKINKILKINTNGRYFGVGLARKESLKMQLIKIIVYISSTVVSLFFLSSTHSQKLSTPLPVGVDKAIIDLVYPIGSVFLDGNGSLIPPGQGLDGIKWIEETNARGHLLIGASSDGAWIVAPGKTAGTLQTTDGHAITRNELPNYQLPTAGNMYAWAFGKHGSTGGGPFDVAPIRIMLGGNNQPHTHGLTNIERYGVKVWKRVS